MKISILFFLLFFIVILATQSPSYSVENSYFKVLEKEANIGIVKAEVTLGMNYVFGYGVRVNYAKAAYWFKKAIMQGNSKAEVNLGSIYLRGGFGVKQNLSKGLYWTERGAQDGSAEGAYDLGLFYENGMGVPQDYKEAAFWFRISAKRYAKLGLKEARKAALAAKMDLKECH